MRSPARATRSGLVTACVVGAVAAVAAILAPGAVGDGLHSRRRRPPGRTRVSS